MCKYYEGLNIFLPRSRTASFKARNVRWIVTYISFHSLDFLSNTFIYEISPSKYSGWFAKLLIWSPIVSTTGVPSRKEGNYLEYPTFILVFVKCILLFISVLDLGSNATCKCWIFHFQMRILNKYQILLSWRSQRLRFRVVIWIYTK